MKTLLVSLFMGFAFLFPNDITTTPSQETADLEIADDTKKRTSARVYIDFGRKRKNCRGFGVCRVVVVAKHTSPSGHASGTVTVDSNRGASLSLDLKSMSPKILKQYFSSAMFVVEEAFSTKLKMEDGKGILLDIKPGKYRMKKTKTSVLIIFNNAKARG